MKNPRVCLLKTDGINCDEELKFAFELAKADPKIVHINELRQKKDYLKRYFPSCIQNLTDWAFWSRGGHS